MDQWTHCWGLTRRSFQLIGRHQSLLWFPVLSGFLSLFCLLFSTLPALYFYSDRSTLTWIQFVSLQSAATILSYFAFSFVRALFDFAVVHASSRVLQSAPMSIADSFGYAVGRSGSVLLWGLFSATVGVVFRLIDRASRKKDGSRRRWLANLQAVAGVAWSAVTAFVVPAMVCEEVGPFEAMQRSAVVLSRTWGTHLVRHVGIGLVAFVCALPVLPMLACAAFLASWQLLLPAALIFSAATLFVLALWVVFRLATTLFDTAVYLYARGGVTAGFDPEQLASAFRVTKA